MSQRKFPAEFLRGGTGKAIMSTATFRGLRVWAVNDRPESELLRTCAIVVV